MTKPSKRSSVLARGLRRLRPAWMGVAQEREPLRRTDHAKRAPSPADGQEEKRPAIPRLSLRSPSLLALIVVTLVVGGANYWQTQQAKSIYGSPSSPPGAQTAPSGSRNVKPAPADPYLSTVAEASVRVVKVYRRPGSPKPSWRLHNPTENGVPLVFLVEEQQDEWIHVNLPVRPNGSTGWIKAEDVEVSHHRYRIVVRLSQHRISVYDGPERVLRSKVAVGTQDTPTPGGVYYIKELLKPPNPNTVYGTYAYGLSGFSNVLETFKGVPAVIGIHGTNDPSVLGSDVSAGCIRMRNKDIEKLVPILPLGTPVVIKE